MINPRSSNTMKGPDALMWVKCGLASAFEDREDRTHSGKRKYRF